MLNKIEKLVENMVNGEVWDAAPEEAQRVANEIAAPGILACISIHPRTGRWYVISISPWGKRIEWEEEGVCELCNGDIDDEALREFRCDGGPPDATIGMPRFCTECHEAEYSTMEDR